MSRVLERVIGTLLLLFLLFYVLFQWSKEYYNPIKTEAVLEYTVSHSIGSTGIAVRSEQVMGESISGVENIVLEDGERVSVNQPVAEFYNSSRGNHSIRRARQLEKEIKMLQEAQDTTVNNLNNTDIINRDIRDQIALLTHMASTNRYSNSEEIKPQLTSLVNRKQISTGKAIGFDARIAQLQGEYDQLEGSTIENDMVVAKAPESGFFTRTVDGYEEIINSSNYLDYSLQEYFDLMEQPRLAVDYSRVGKIVTNANWQFIAGVPKHSLDWIHVGREVSLSFDYLGISVPATILNVQQDNDTEQAIVILTSNYISGDIINIRKADVTIHFQTISGLRIYNSDIRIKDGKKGVYVLQGDAVQFKEIDLIYEDTNFVLSRINYIGSNNNYVCLFEQVVKGGGVDLVDGKIVS